MTTTAHAAAAAAARQRLASVLGTLQQNPNVPPQVLEILSGLARAMGPLFQLERGSSDLSLFQTARQVLQETLEKIQVADQRFPGVSDATEAVAGTLGVIFKAMRDAGVAPGQPAAAPAQQASPMPLVSQPQPHPQFAQPQQPAYAPPAQPQPQFAQPQQPAYAPPAQPQPQFAQPQQPAYAPPAQPQQPAYAPPAQPQQPAYAPPAQPKPAFAPQPAPHAPPQAAPPSTFGAHGAQPAASGKMPAPSGHGPAASGTVPMGPHGLPLLESEIGVHSETNFYTDFLGDIRANGGIFVATFHVLPLGAQCEVSLTFPGNLVTEFRGVVRWKRENAPGASLAASPGMGIEITQADAAAWDLITRFIRKREPIMHEM